MVEDLPHKKRKTRKKRGSRTMGYGRVSQHRKGGGKGGKGRAGGRKHFWIRTLKYEPDRYKKIGFKPPSALGPPLETINVGELEDLAFLVLGAEGRNTGEEPLELDLAGLGYEKLLGRGGIGIPVRLKVADYSSKALEKIEAADGEIVETE
jgi:large subunit ribosomal protein L15